MSKKKPTYELYTKGVDMPVIKDAYNLVFANDPYEAIVEMDLLQDFADRLFEGNVHKAEQDLKGANAMTIVFQSKNVLLMILPFTVTPGVLAHECYHMVNIIAQRKGIYYSSDSEEVFAHMIDWMVEDTTYWFKEMKKLRRENKKKAKK